MSKASKKAASASQREAASVLKTGGLYYGVVTKKNSDDTYAVRLDSPRKTLNNVQTASAVLGGVIGYVVRSNLSLKTRVVVAYGSASFIVGVVGRKEKYGTRARTVTHTATKAKDKEGPPADMLDGEFEIANSFGMAMQFLTTLIKMSASDRAIVEVHALNDMVRIISGQFRHISPLGEELMFDHGRPTMERSWTSYRHELFGKSKTTEPLSDADGDEMKMTVEERVSAVGKHRLLEYFGFAGDFLHSFITDPCSAALSLSQEATDSAGKSWIHRNSDGSIVMQSVADIAIERVCRIPVPLRVAPHESREAALERHYDKLNAEYLKDFDNGSESPANAYRAAHQLRVYARWLSRYHSLARIAQLDKDYRIPKESDAAAPSWGGKEEDKELLTRDYVEAYACIRIMRDGSIVILDGYGSSANFSNGNVSVSAARHIELEAAGDIRVTAGGSFFLKAKRHVELTASEGGLLMYGMAFMKMLADRGSLMLRSNADTETNEAPQPASSGAPVPEVAVNGSEKHAVSIEAPNGRILTRSRNRQTHAIDGSSDAGACDFVVDTKGDLALKSRDLALYVARDFMQAVGRNIIISAALVLGRVADWFVAGVRVKGGKFYAQSAAIRNLEANKIYSDEVSHTQPANERTAVPRHFNHVLSRKNTDPIVLPEDVPTAASELLAEAVSSVSSPAALVTWRSASEGHQWAFLPAAEYYWDNRDEQAGTYVESLTQQHIRLDIPAGTDQWGKAGYDVWTPSLADNHARMGSRASWGCEVWHFRCNAGDSLYSTVNIEVLNLPSQADWVLTKRTFNTLKRL